MRVLVTGACGFLGRALIRELESAHELRLLDRARPEEATVFAPAEPGGRRFAPFETSWPFVAGDITDPDVMLEATKDVDAVVHLAAAVTGLPEFGVETFHTNAVGTYVVLDACRKNGVGRFLCASSINAFGTFYWRLSGRPVVYDSLPLEEDFEVVVEDAYSLSKFVNEHTAAAFHRAYGMTTAAFRFAGVWSPERYAQLKAAMAPTTEWSDDLYQWVHADDVVTGLRQALEAPDLPGFGVYTLGAADTRCPEQTMDILERFRPELVKMLKWPLKGREPLLSIRRAREAFGYAPRYRLGP